jgi:hypothetical protein
VHPPTVDAFIDRSIDRSTAFVGVIDHPDGRMGRCDVMLHLVPTERILLSKKNCLSLLLVLLCRSFHAPGSLWSREIKETLENPSSCCCRCCC